MNTDIRVATTFRGHRKRRKLDLRLGTASAGFIVDLWIGAAESRPDGVLAGWDESDIALEAGWTGDPGEFVRALVETGWLDHQEDGAYALHDWIEHNGYAAAAADRSGKGLFSNLKRWHPDLAAELAAQGVSSITKEEYARITTGRKPNPSPIPDRIGTESDPIPKGNPPAPAPAPAPIPSPTSKDSSSVPSGAEPGEQEFLPAKGGRKRPPTFAADSEPHRLARYLLDSIRRHNPRFKPTFKEGDLQRWAAELDKVVRLDGRTVAEVESIITWAMGDPFWKGTIESAGSIRKNFDKLLMKSNGGGNANQLRNIGPAASSGKYAGLAKPL